MIVLAHFTSQVNAQVNFKRFSGGEYGSIVKFSPDGKSIMTASDNKIDVWIANTARLSHSLPVKGAKNINEIEFLGEDTLIISDKGDDIFIYDLKNEKVVSLLKGHTGKVTAIELSTDGTKLFSSSADGTTILWNIPSRTIIKKYNDHKADVLATAFSSSTGRFASCGKDGLVNVYSESGEKIFSKNISGDWLWSLEFSVDGNSIVTCGNQDAYIITDIVSPEPDISTLKGIKGKPYSLHFSPDGNYFAIGTTQQYIYMFDWATKAVVATDKLSDGDIMDIEFDPGGKSMISTHSNYKGIVKWDLRSLNILPSKYLRNNQDKIPPQIYVSNPVRITDERVVVFADFIKLQGVVMDETGVLQLKINSTNVNVSENGSFSLNLPLSFSETPITIEARDVNQNVSLKRFTIIRKTTTGSDYDAATARNYLLVIGINDYLEWPKLYNATNDANGIAGTLSGLYNFNFSDITILLDSQATRSNIYNTLRGYAEKVGPKDNFMIYFSGHGFFDKILNEGYWVPVEAERKSIANLVSNSDVLKIIRSVNSQHTLLIADACFSGSLFMESGRGDYTENVEKFRSRWGFTSGRLEVVSDGEIGKNSPFAQAMLEFFRSNTKQKFAVSELIQNVKMKVAGDTKQTPIGNPLKNVGDEGGEFIFYKKN